MQTQSIKIEAPEGYSPNFDKEAGVITFKEKPKDVTERITTIADVLAELGDNDEDVIDYRKVLSVFSPEHHTVNYQLCVIIIKALNEKRLPYWDNSNELKWTLWFYMGGSSGFRYYGFVDWRSASHVGSRLCFMEKRLGLHAVEQPEFFNAFKNFMTIKK